MSAGDEGLTESDLNSVITVSMSEGFSLALIAMLALCLRCPASRTAAIENKKMPVKTATTADKSLLTAFVIIFNIVSILSESVS
jgi:hypothetical protein